MNNWAEFETISKARLMDAPCLHVDETGININGKRHWLHSASNDQWTHFFPHARRGNGGDECDWYLAALSWHLMS